MTHTAGSLAVASLVAAGFALASATGSAAGATTDAGADVGAQVALLVAAVALLGLPHGAFDAVIGEEAFRPRLGRGWGVAFSAGYLGSAGLVVGLWVVAPPVALAAFFAAAAWHFGTTDAGGHGSPAHGRPAARERVFRAADAAARGVLTIAAPSAFHPAEVARLLRWTMPGGAAWMTPEFAGRAGAAALLVVAPVLVASTAWHATRAGRLRAGRLRAGSGVERWRHGLAAAEPAVLVGLFAAAPPLVAFVVYFCGLHSVRHELHLVGRVAAESPGRTVGGSLRWVVARAAPATAVTIVGAGVAFAWLLRSGGAAGDPSASAVRVVFVGLSALTVPHMLLEAWADRRVAAGSGHEASARASGAGASASGAPKSASGASSGRRASRS